MEIKVFVVDDEERQRKSIIRHVDWQRYGMRVSGEAEAAEEAIKMAHAEPPDVLITDIRMLGMDGLQLSAIMRTLNPQLHVIMITGYEEFEYARTAVGLGVDAFLVKPVLFDELEGILYDINSSIQAAWAKSEEEQRLKVQLDTFKPMARDKFLQELLHGLILTEEELVSRASSLNLFKQSQTYRVMVLLVEMNTRNPMPQQEHQGLLTSICDVAASGLGNVLAASMTTQRGHLVLILQDISPVVLRQGAEAVMASLRRDNQDLYGGSLYAGLGPEVTGPGHICDSFRLAQRAVNQRLISQEQKLYIWENSEDKTASAVKSIEDLIQEFLEGLGVGDSQTSLGLLGEIMRRLAKDARMDGAQLRSLCMHLVSAASRVAGEIGDIGSQIGSEKELWEEMLECPSDYELMRETVRMVTRCCEFVAERKKSPTQMMIQHALEYMHEHYDDNLSLRDVAEHVFLSPNYVGELFRTELGVSFTDQLIQIRVNKAKELLQLPQLKLYEVAQRVGYQNIGYFNTVFKKVTGYTPKQYRSYIGIGTGHSD
ncbi:response regulator [Paenibacillus daejeonensis]|uniref:response regulator n=1 Tax=Paenibacillus daejeonensis TaxID=135193 RepID=UPI000381F764|nr:response regulator [Paenibacillus daejeonensis]